MIKNYQKKFKIEVSTNNPNYYIIFRKKFFNFQEVAFAKVIPGYSYQLEALLKLKAEELQYIQKQLQKIADIENCKSQICTF